MCWENKNWCWDCGCELHVRVWKGPGNGPYGGLSQPHYCDPCINKALKEGCIFRDGRKTSPAIELLVAESEIAAKQTVQNQFY